MPNNTNTMLIEMGIKAGILLDGDDWGVATANLSEADRARAEDIFIEALEGGDVETAKTAYTSALWGGRFEILDFAS